MNHARRILFVSHKANMSGAPLLLLNIVKEFTKRKEFSVKILCMEDGELLGQFRQVAETFLWNKKRQPAAVSVKQAFVFLVSRPFGILRGLYILFRIRKTDIIFFNTITNGHIHKKLLFLKAKNVCYVHELEAAIHMLTSDFSLDIALKNTDVFFAVSKAVKQNLIQKHQVDEKNIYTVASPVPATVRDKKEYNLFIGEFRRKRNIPGNAVIIGVAASSEWRKGFDLFAPLISVYFKLYPHSNVFFVWKGFRSESITGFLQLYDFEKSKKYNRDILLPHDTDSLETIACFDIHLLLSREDPYPLVILEAASFGIPTVCFKDAGGGPEFIEDDAGFCVCYGDLVQMSNRLYELAENENLRKEMGQNAKEKLMLRHSEKEAINKLINIVSEL
jgi:glycosyltransferase involved in cell wall biosynthesis